MGRTYWACEHVARAIEERGVYDAPVVVFMRMYVFCEGCYKEFGETIRGEGPSIFERVLRKVVT